MTPQKQPDGTIKVPLEHLDLDEERERQENEDVEAFL